MTTLRIAGVTVLAILVLAVPPACAVLFLTARRRRDLAGNTTEHDELVSGRHRLSETRVPVTGSH